MPRLRSQNEFRLRYQIVALTCLLMLAACQSALRAPPPAVENVPPLPDAPIFAVDAHESEISVLARRDGPLAKFGHHHVLIAPVSGVIHAGDTASNSGFRLAVDANEFAVDPPAARAAEGEDFSSEISADARAATRRNLLGKALLDAENHPRILLQSLGMHGPRWNPTVRARLTLRGVERDIEFPAAVVAQENALVVIAQFAIRQSDFGIEPFSTLGGGLSVQDELTIRARIVARARQE